ncbi:MAG: hypothetical protein U9R44_06650 [Candidatus Omnitrophota bacterium]|nr:hypothetical protein [Candidatus Omnitrophota bacterium]
MRKIHKKCCIQFVALVLIIAFPNMSVSSYYHPWETGVCGSTNLSPQIRSNPLLDNGIGDIYELKTFILNNVAGAPETLSGLSHDMGDMDDVYLVPRSKPIDVLFSKAVRLKRKIGFMKDGPDNVLVIPCLIGGEPFYAHLFSYGKTRAGITVYSKEEYAQEREKFSGIWEMSDEDNGRLESISSLDVPEISVIDITDKSARLAAEFLEKIHAGKLKKRLEGIAGVGKLLAARGPSLAAGGIVIDRSRDEETRAWSILRQLLLLVDKDISEPDIDGLKTAFTEFYKNRDSFDLETFDPGLRLTLLSLEGEKKIASNEGGIQFLPEAYTHMIDLSDITLEMCEKDGIIGKIENTFRYVKQAEMWDYLEKTKKRRDSISKEDLVPRRILIKRLSNGIIPTVKETEDGIVLINENFVKILYKLKQMAIRSRNDPELHKKSLSSRAGYIYGMIGDPSCGCGAYLNGRPALDEFYSAVIYSAALHTIRGHFRIENGVHVFNPDEEWAQGERGKEHLYSNLIATLYFWFIVVEGRKEIARSDVEAFFETNKGLARNIKCFGTDDVADIVFKTVHDFKRLKMDPRALPRVPVPEMPVPAPAKVFRALSQKARPLDIYDIADMADGADPEKVPECLSDLIKTGAVRIADKQDGEVDLPKYSVESAVLGYAGEVEEILEQLGPAPKKEELLKARVEIGLIMTGERKKPEKNKTAAEGPAPEETKETPALQREDVRTTAKDMTPGEEAAKTLSSADISDKAAKEPAVEDKALSVLSPVWTAATAVFRMLSSEGGVFTSASIAERLGDTDPGMISASISTLIGIGIVNKYTKRKGEVLDRPLYGTARVAGARAREVLEILDSVAASPAEADLPELKAKILKVTDPVWASAFVDAAVKGVGAQAVKETGKKMVIAVETGWVPETQKAFIQGLVQELDKLERKGTVRIVRGSADELAGKLLDVVKEEKTPLKNIIVLADKKTIIRKEFAPIRARDDSDTDKAFIVGVDAEKLTDDSYIRLMEMLTMAVRMALGLKPLSNHPNIGIGRVNSRLYIFMPKAEPVDLETIKALYNTQRRVLTAV